MSANATKSSWGNAVKEERAATGTRTRLLNAAEELFIERGYASLSLRMVTLQARANSASANYYFGTKEALVREVLTRRLDHLHRARLRLLEDCEANWKQRPDHTDLLGVLFIPVLKLSLAPAEGPALMRLLWRIRLETSAFVHDNLHRQYGPVYKKFFESFARALPDMARDTLKLHLNFVLKTLHDMLADTPLEKLSHIFSAAHPASGREVLARLIALIGPVLGPPLDYALVLQKLERIEHFSDRQPADAAWAATGDANSRAVPSDGLIFV